MFLCVHLLFWVVKIYGRRRLYGFCLEICFVFEMGLFFLMLMVILVISWCCCNYGDEVIWWCYTFFYLTLNFLLLQRNVHVQYMQEQSIFNLIYFLYEKSDDFQIWISKKSDLFVSKFWQFKTTDIFKKIIHARNLLD